MVCNVCLVSYVVYRLHRMPDYVLEVKLYLHPAAECAKQKCHGTRMRNVWSCIWSQKCINICPT